MKIDRLILGNSGIAAIVGPMFAGKSRLLIQAIQRAREQQMDFLVVKPALDIQVRGDKVKSRNGTAEVCLLIDTQAALDLPKTNLLFVDEAQFCTPQIIEEIRLLSRTTRVIFAGLTHDSQGRDFGLLSALIRSGQVDTLVQLTARCSVCAAPAVHSQRLVKTGGQVFIDDAVYEPRCESHWEPR